jgi:hypothetical protein
MMIEEVHSTSLIFDRSARVLTNIFNKKSMYTTSTSTDSPPQIKPIERSLNLYDLMNTLSHVPSYKSSKFALNL